MRYLTAGLLIITLAGCGWLGALIQPIVQPLDAANKVCEQTYSGQKNSDGFYQALCKADIVVQAGWIEYKRQKDLGVPSVYLDRWSSKLTDAGNKLNLAQSIYAEREIDTLTRDQLMAELLLEIQRWAYTDG